MRATGADSLANELCGEDELGSKFSVGIYWF